MIHESSFIGIIHNGYALIGATSEVQTRQGNAFYVKRSNTETGIANANTKTQDLEHATIRYQKHCKPFR